MKQRIQKLLANAGVDSRRHVEQMIRQGRVAVNGKVMVDLPILIDPRIDKVTVDGERIHLDVRDDELKIYILMHKPKGVYTTNVAQGEQKLAINLLPPDLPARVYPVGRLDASSRGLLLLTNDGGLTHQLTHPSFGVSKTYRATVEGFVTDAQLGRIAKSIGDSGKRARRSKDSGQMKVIRRSQEMTILEITMHEWRNREVRQVLAEAGHKLRDLARIRIGTLGMGNLSPGDFRLLNPKEIRQLRKLGKTQPA